MSEVRYVISFRQREGGKIHTIELSAEKVPSWMAKVGVGCYSIFLVRDRRAADKGCDA